MKKLITIILTLSMLVLLIVPSFADSTKEEAAILEAAKEGIIVASLFTTQELFYSVYDTTDLEISENEIYDFMQGLIKHNKVDGGVYHVTYHPYDGEMVQDPSSQYWQNFDCIYAETGDQISSTDDAKELVDKYLLGFTNIIDDENTVKLVDGKYKSRHPELRTINSKIYVNVGSGNFPLTYNKTYFDEFTIISVDGDSAIVNAPQFDSYNQKKVDLTIELKKKNGLWKVCGGTMFSYKWGSFSSYPFAPSTGENFSLITHTIVIAVSVVLMVLLSKSRRKIDNI